MPYKVAFRGNFLNNLKKLKKKHKPAIKEIESAIGEVSSDPKCGDVKKGSWRGVSGYGFSKSPQFRIFYVLKSKQT